MIISIFNHFFKRVDVLRKYTFAQYTDRFNEIGTFSVLCPICEDNMIFFSPDWTYFLHFEDGVMGIVESAKKNSDGEFENEIILSGRLMGYILNERIMYKQNTFKGKAHAVIKSAIEKCFSGSFLDDARYIKFVYGYKNIDVNLLPTIEVQQTGGTLFSFIQDLMIEQKLGYDIIPQITEEHEIAAIYPLTNIDTWNLNICQGVDRTEGNTKGNQPILFSNRVSNISRITLERDRSEYSNVAYIAGEGEGKNRVWTNAYPDGESALKFTNIGWLRREIFVDARDLQKETEDKTYTNAEYLNLLKQRGLEKLREHVIAVRFDATEQNAKIKYKYGRNADYYKGDFVTVEDTETGIKINVQIRGITKTIQGEQEILDIEFGDGLLATERK